MTAAAALKCGLMSGSAPRWIDIMDIPLNCAIGTPSCNVSKMTKLEMMFMFLLNMEWSRREAENVAADERANKE